MAVDTRQKRFSMMSFGTAIRFNQMWEVDGNVDLDDKQHLLNCYSGIPFNDISGPVAPFDYFFSRRGSGKWHRGANNV